MRAARLLAAGLLGALALSLAACGFHLRRSAQLPPGMETVHVDVRGGGDLQRQLVQALEVAGTRVADKPGPGVAELNVPVASFRNDALTVNRFSRIGEYAVRYHVEFEARAADGTVLAPRQSIDMSREFTYDATQTIGSGTQTEVLQQQMQRDAVQAILLRLQAAAQHPQAAQKAQQQAAPPGGDAGDSEG
jgi:LPS-assembly lipoprotein